MIVETVFLSILGQMEFHLVQDQIENCHNDHIPFNMKENVSKVFLSVKKQLDMKSVTDQTCSCSRDWRLSASGGLN